jgi:hypothetical protein
VPNFSRVTSYGSFIRRHLRVPVFEIAAMAGGFVDLMVMELSAWKEIVELFLHTRIRL